MKNIRPFICGAAMLAGALCSNLPTAQAAPPGNRYLLIVETAKVMKKAMPAVQQCVRSLLASGMSGQLQPGDTLGLWTYNDALHAGDFPMQVWSPDAAAATAKRVDEFLGKQHCRGEARITEALAAMFPVVGNSDHIIVLIFSDGFEPVQGTPFDAVINPVFAQHREELRNVRIPFVTVLQASGGKIIHCTINSASGPINIPAPPKPAPVVAAPKPVAPAPAPVLLNTNPPLILDYSKPATNAAPAKAIAPGKPPGAAATAAVPIALPKPAPAAVVATQSPPPAVARTEVPPVVPPVAPAPASVVPGKSESVVTSTNSPPPAPAPPDAAVGWVWLALGLAGLGIVASWLVWRARSAPRVSAITESIERRKR